MESTIQIFVYMHAFFGGIGLLTGVGSIWVKKGQAKHKRLGMWFSWSMIISCFISLVIASLPNHENLFLFLIGIFTIYMVLAGNRALTFKSNKKTKANFIDKLVSGGMLTCGIIMIGLGTYYLSSANKYGIILLVFGGFGIFMPVFDFVLFAKTLKNRKLWLITHISRMLGALIASFTAFFVAGLKYDNLVAWLLPTVLGTVYIIYWIRKTKGKIGKRKI